MRLFPKLTKRDLLIIFALTAAYFALNLTSLTKLPIFVDEALYLRWAQIAGGDATWRFISLTDGKQPLYTWFVIPFLQLIADPLAAGRTASVVAGYFTLLGTAYSGWLIGNKRLGFVAGFLTLFSPFIFFYNRFGVMESLLTAFGIWSFALSLLLAKYRRLDLAMITGIVVGLGMLVKSSGLFFLIFLPVAYLLQLKKQELLSRQSLRYLALATLAALFAGVLYNVQRLSPWMHMIGQKNAFFVVPYSEVFKEPARLLNNLKDIFRWHFAYTTPPVVLTSLTGLYLQLRRDRRLGLTLLIWTAGMLGGTAAIARLYAPRYIAFITPFVLLFAAYPLALIKNNSKLVLTTVLVSLYPCILISQLLTDPIHFPYTSVDEGYVNGWSAGNGTKQISEWAVQRVGEVGPGVTIYTEGTFGILPHGLELYTDQRAPGLVIQGIYPINEIPPQITVEQAIQNPETYLVLNNTQTTSVPDGLKLVAEYPKVDTAYSMRLYRVLSQ